jgi:diguanylate cyclase (GGDEF)-like protein
MRLQILAATDFALYAFTFAIILLTITLIYFLIRGVKRDIRGVKNESDDYFGSVKGLKSRSQLLADINQYIETHPNPELTLIYLDIDNFKGVNDAFGQRQGDVILTTLAQRLVKVLPRFSSIGNFAGDDFIIFIRGDFPTERVENYIKELQEVIAQPFEIFSDDIVLSASIGVVQAPYNGKHAKILLSNLEVAMYVSKREGKNRYTIFDSELSEKETDNASYYQQVKKAIAKNEFVLHYQPIVQFSTGEIVGVEGLIRWNHPEMGLIAPAKFLNILEQTGDINWVGQWGFESVVKFAIEFKKTFPNKSMMFTFNLSPKQLMSKTIVDEYRRLLKKYKEDASTYCLEVIEFALFEKYGQIKENLLEFKKLGFKIAIDDFGLDTAALKRLEVISVDVIKLNRKFANSTKGSFLTEKIAEMLAQYADKENKMVIVEGLEDSATISYFETLGIKYGQGYFYSEPKPSRDIIADYTNGPYKIVNTNNTNS